MTEKREAGDTRSISETINSLGWALFFVWLGVALLFDVGWGVGLVGVGAITLAGQAARKYFGLPLEGFWAVVGFIFLLGGTWELFEITLPLLPLLLIGAGLVLLIGALGGRHLARRSHG